METPELISENVSIRIIVVADHVILRQGIHVMLNKEDDFEIVGEAENGKVALKLVAELEPDIVLIDTSLEATNGLGIAQQLRKKLSEHKGRFICWLQRRETALRGSTDRRSRLPA